MAPVWTRGPVGTTMRDNVLLLIMSTAVRNSTGMRPTMEPTNMLQMLLDKGVIDMGDESSSSLDSD